MIANRQDQRVSVSKKQSEGWYMPNIHYYIGMATSLNNKNNTKENLDSANGIIDTKTYNYVLNPIQFDGDAVKKLPGEIRDVDFINPIREKNIGEYLELPHNYTVKVDDPNTSLLRNKQVAEELMPVLQQAVINLINNEQNNPNGLQQQLNNQQQQPQQQGQQGQEQQPQQPQQQQQSQMPISGVPSTDIKDIKALIKETTDNWFDSRADRANNLVQWICDNNDSENKRLTLFNYWWSTEECYIHTYIDNNEVLYEIINPLEGYTIDNSYEFVDDHEAFVIMRHISINSIYERYEDDLSNKDIEYLTELLNRTDAGGLCNVTAQVYSDIYGRKVFDTDNNAVPGSTNYNISRNGLIREVILYFKTSTQRRILYKYNQLGNIVSEVIQDKDFIFDESQGHINIEKEWITETWKQVLLGQDYMGIYLKPEPIPVQIYDATGHNKLPIVGKKGLINGVYINPIPHRIAPNLALYRIVTLQIERQFAKYKGSMEIIPKSMLLGDNGDIKGNMFYRIADGTIIYDDQIVDFNTVAQGYRIVGNDAVTNYIKSLIEFRDTLKSEAWDMANMNESRYGNAPASATVTNNNQNIFRAKLGSVLMITTFNSILLKLYRQLIEYSKVAYANGISGAVHNDAENKITYFNIDSGELTENNYGIFMSNAVLDLNKLEEYKKLAFSASQNGDFDIAMEAIDSNNVSRIRKHVKELVKANKEYQHELELQKQQTLAQINEEKMQSAQADRDNELAKVKLKEELITNRDLKLAASNNYNKEKVNNIYK